MKIEEAIVPEVCTGFARLSFGDSKTTIKFIIRKSK
jgi:hypothetical protein